MTKSNTPRYTKGEREKLTARMLPPENCPITQLSAETGISRSALSTWKSKTLKKSNTAVADNTNRTISSKEKFLVVMETYTMSEMELSRYCREKGLYLEGIKKWRTSCISANDVEIHDAKELKQELQEEKKKIKSLEKELSRKEKALAETAALLVLRKKLDAILGETEEDQ